MIIKKRNRIILVLFVKFLFLLLIIILFIKIFLPNNTFNVNVITENIIFEVAEDSYQKIPLNSAFYMNDFFSENRSMYTGSFRPSPHSRVEIERKMNEALRISITASPDTNKNSYDSGNKAKIKDLTAGVFYTDKDRIDDCIIVKDFIEFYIPFKKNENPQQIIIPFRGKVNTNAGAFAFVPNSGAAILKEGKVQLIGQTILRNAFYIGDTYNLNIGDQIRLEDRFGSLVNCYGIIVINADVPGMAVNYKAMAEQAIIYTPGPVKTGQGYTIEESLFSRFSNDLFFIILSWFIGAIVFFASLLEYKNEADIFLEKNNLLGKTLRKNK